MKFTVLKQYKSDTAGPFEAGQIVELTEDLAAWVNRDAKGTLEPYVAERAPEKPANDRMVRGRRKRNEP